jgi:hypothetical protein
MFKQPESVVVVIGIVVHVQRVTSADHLSA